MRSQTRPSEAKMVEEFARNFLVYCKSASKDIVVIAEP
jgi:hypothetical protein